MTGVISLHIGQCGVQVGNAVWELLCIEHSIGPDGEVMCELEHGHISSFFQEANNNRYSPRVIYIDTEQTVIDEIRTGVYRELYHPDQLITGIEDAANNFARGSFYVGTEILKNFRKRLHKLVEQVDHLETFILYNSVGGGTGSGTGALFLQQIMLDFPKVMRMQFPILPGPLLSTSVVEPYNSVFHLHTTMETVDLSTLFDNEALYDMCQNLLHIQRPNYSELNRLQAMMISSISCSMRFDSTLNTALQEIHTNLIPYPRIHFSIVRHAPIENANRCSYSTKTVEDITKDVFRRDHTTIKCDTSRGKYISVILNYRGLVSPREISESVNKHKPTISFVEWCPTGFKIGINHQTPVVVPDSKLSISDKAVTMVCNTTAVCESWKRLGRKFDLLFDRRAFSHWFISEGMEESEFGESRFDLQLLEEDYEEISLSEEEIIATMERNPSRKSRSMSFRQEPDNFDEQNSGEQTDLNALGEQNTYGEEENGPNPFMDNSYETP